MICFNLINSKSKAHYLAFLFVIITLSLDIIHTLWYNIVKNINKEELLVNAGNGNVKDFKIEYDKEHISEIFKYPY